MDEKKLIKKIKKKDQRALMYFIEKYGPILKGATSPILVSNKEIMEEVLDDTFIAVWDNIDSFDPSRSSFKNRCAGLAKYKAIDALRKEIRHQAVSTEDIGEIACEDEIDLGEAEEILKYLKENDRLIFEKLFLEGYSYDDIAKGTGLTKEVLYNRVSRAKKVIRLNLKEEKNEKCF